VELVLNELPQEQVTVISLYAGWISGFMAGFRSVAVRPWMGMGGFGSKGRRV